jgi:hypothetical protein
MNKFFLKRLRKIFKSLGKYEYKILDKITLLENKKIKIDDKVFFKFEKDLEKSSFIPKKISIVICFHFNKKKIINLQKICANINSFKFSKNVSIITNNINKINHNFLKKKLKNKLKNFNIIKIKNIPEPNLLPWYCLDFMKKSYKDKSFSHFLYLEDDILINENNINYWIFARKILKKFNFIPAFLRCENNGKRLFSVDNPKPIKIKNTPRILSTSEKFGFLNLRYPYHASCLMDRDLMKEYTKSKLVGIDYGLSHNIMKTLYPIKELANIIIGYINVPKGYYNRFFLPFINSNKIPNYCIIKHIDNKYIKIKNEHFGKININHLLK